MKRCTISWVPNIDQEEVVVDADDDSSDDDIVDETVKEMHEILVKVLSIPCTKTRLVRRVVHGLCHQLFGV
jgi:hypothetical protein